ncbi:hypothetical protein AB0B79_06850 [Streptomyces sp. NPDC039022]|uniref:hypothetical protein n=1 Tax=unclassified Streptomyces TaxID=2593676 RepID=UPI0033D61872
MTKSSGELPVIDHPDVEAALVEIFEVAGPEAQESATSEIFAHWKASTWPTELVSANCYRSTDGKSLLTYTQWSSRKVLENSFQQDHGIIHLTRGRELAGARTKGAKAFQLYRVVRGGAITDPAPVPQCFPAAVFPMRGVQAARDWIDGLLAAEEKAEGEERAYPGAIAANFHVSLDGTSVLVLSEWASEKEAAEHIDEVIEPLLEAAGGGDAGARYTHSFTLRPPSA